MRTGKGAQTGPAAFILREGLIMISWRRLKLYISLSVIKTPWRVEKKPKWNKILVVYKGRKNKTKIDHSIVKVLPAKPNHWSSVLGYPSHRREQIPAVDL